MGTAPADTLAQLRDRAPLIYDTLIESMFAGPLSHPELGRTQRELATVAVLAALGGAERQLAIHTRAALQLGLQPSELLALCEHVAAYAGFPRALNAVAVVDEVAREAGHPRPPRLRHVTLEDHETVVAEAGESGPPVLLVHALGLDWRMWEPVMSELAQRAAGVRLRHPRPRSRGGFAGPVHDGRHGGRPRRRARRARARARARRRPLLRRRHRADRGRPPSRAVRVAGAAGHDRLPVHRRVRDPRALGRDRRHGGAGRAVADALVHAGGAGARRLGRPLRPRAGAARQPRPTGPRPGGRSRASTSRAGWPTSSLRRSSSPASSTPPRRRRSWAASTAASPARRSSSCRARRTCRRSSSPSWSPRRSARSCPQRRKSTSADASSSGASSAMWWPESIRTPVSGPSVHGRQTADRVAVEVLEVVVRRPGDQRPGSARSARPRGRRPRRSGRPRTRPGTRATIARTTSGLVTARRQSVVVLRARAPPGSARYQASGSRTIQSSAGLAVWAKKNQCHQSAAKRSSQRSRCSTIGMPSISASRVAPWSTASRCAHGEPRSWPTTAYDAKPQRRHHRRQRVRDLALGLPRRPLRLAVAREVRADDA